MITNVLRFPIAETTCFAIVGTYCGKAKGDPRDHGYLDSGERYELGRYVTKGTAERVLSAAQAKLDKARATVVQAKRALEMVVADLSRNLPWT